MVLTRDFHFSAKHSFSALCPKMPLVAQGTKMEGEKSGLGKSV